MRGEREREGEGERDGEGRERERKREREREREKGRVQSCRARATMSCAYLPVPRLTYLSPSCQLVRECIMIIIIEFV